MLWLLNLSLNRRVNLTDVKARVSLLVCMQLDAVQIIVCHCMLLKSDWCYLRFWMLI